MPGFAVHYLFGEETLSVYNYNLIKKSISRYRDVYNLGLQGPDMFFYFFLSPIFLKKNLGSVMHRTGIGEFKKNYIDRINKIRNREKKMIAISYFAGFIGHCTLDKICHPYVYAMTDYDDEDKDYFGRHVELETEIDSIYTKKYKNIELCDFKCRDKINLDSVEVSVIADMFSDVVEKTYSDVKLSKKMMEFIISFYMIFVNIFIDKYGIKKKLMQLFEKLVLRRRCFSPLFVEKNITYSHKDPLNTSKNIWISPWESEKKRKDSFYELFGIAVKEYCEVLDEINEYLESDNAQCLQLSIENISLHSGLDCSIPS